jgi:2-polyprenyl-3-methyl-5-hydroxy-6-metoxy-1,4-benzoquinol methylase
MSVTATETEKYAELWQSVGTYGEHSPGVEALPLFLQMIGPERGTVLDAGTGSGKGAIALAAEGFQVTCCDVTNAGMVPEAKGFPFHAVSLWTDLWPIARATGHPGRSRFDYVYCTDVLEHIPPQFTMLAIDQMLRVAKQALFLSVCLRADGFGAWIGQPLHQTVQPFTWWRDSLKELGTIVEARDLLTDAAFLVTR